MKPMHEACDTSSRAPASASTASARECACWRASGGTWRLPKLLATSSSSSSKLRAPAGAPPTIGRSGIRRSSDPARTDMFWEVSRFRGYFRQLCRLA
jgi:hypothetical protein